MQGELRGDFTRNTHAPHKQFLRVLMQQGRVQLDADFNEQVSILLHYLQTLATDLIGPYGGPVGNAGFAIAPSPNNNGSIADLTISPGRYYVEGLLCENMQLNASYEHQPYLPVKADYKDDYPDLPFLVYLDVWERHVDSIQDADVGQGSIRELALGGADTATRSQVVWQVKLTQQLDKSDDEDSSALKNILGLELDSETLPPEPVAEPGAEAPNEPTTAEDADLATRLQKAADILRTNPDALYLASPDIVPESQLAKLKARTQDSRSSDDTDPCIVSPDARYRGAENQLYRVEIHSGGNQPTFKWSRENSAVVFPIKTIGGAVITLEHLGYDSRFGLQENDWIEIIDDEYIYRNQPQQLLQIQRIDVVTQQVTLNQAPDGNTGRESSNHPYLRRWDHRAGNPHHGGHKLATNGAIPVAIQKNGDPEIWQMLEDGIQIQFQPGKYRPGDYWLIPARTATGDVEWPRDNNSGQPLAMPPHGVKHYYAPLAIIADKDGEIKAFDCRREFSPVSSNSD